MLIVKLWKILDYEISLKQIFCSFKPSNHPIRCVAGNTLILLSKNHQKKATTKWSSKSINHTFAWRYKRILEWKQILNEWKKNYWNCKMIIILTPKPSFWWSLGFEGFMFLWHELANWNATSLGVSVTMLTKVPIWSSNFKLKDPPWKNNVRFTCFFFFFFFAV